MRSGLVILVVVTAFVGGGTASAADPGRWMLKDDTGVPLEYFQGITVDRDGNFFFDGIFTGLYKGRPEKVADAPATSISSGSDDVWTIVETARSADVIPPEVRDGEGYNHIGDLTWALDDSGGNGRDGRLLLPLECFQLGDSQGGNACLDPDGNGVPPLRRPGTGAIGVAVENKLKLVRVGDKLVRSFDWEYYVKLDEQFLTKAMWAEVSEDGKLLWTQGGDSTGGPGDDLLAYRVSEITAANAADPRRDDNVELAPVEQLRDVVPTGIKQITGATFLAGRLYVAGHVRATDLVPDLFQVWSLDVESCSLVTFCDRRLEIERRFHGESEGLAAACTLNGLLHWQIAPRNEEFFPTWWMDAEGTGRTTILSFLPDPSTGIRGCQT